jgi:acyl carrier protein
MTRSQKRFRENLKPLGLAVAAVATIGPLGGALPAHKSDPASGRHESDPLPTSVDLATVGGAKSAALAEPIRVRAVVVAGAASPPILQMSNKEILQITRGIIARHLGVEMERLTPGTRFTEDLGANSLKMVEIAMEAEDAFGCEIRNDDIWGVATVSDAYNLLLRCKRRAAQDTA